MTKPDLMFDTETLGTGHDAVVLSLAVIPFNPYARTLRQVFPAKLGYFYTGLDAKAQLDAGRKISADTAAWWMQSPEQFAETITLPLRRTPTETEALLKAWANPLGFNNVWCQGPHFDQTILEDMIQLPWRFFEVRDSRTVQALGRQVLGRDDLNSRVLESLEKLGLSGAAHDALYDCRVQALTVWHTMKALKLNG